MTVLSVVEGRFSFACLLDLIFSVAAAKGSNYKDSWAKRGLFSITQNLERKWNRIENMLFEFDVEKLALESDESVLETIMDLAVYCLLTLVYFKQIGKQNHLELFGDSFDKMVERNISFASKINKSDFKFYYQTFFNKSICISNLLDTEKQEQIFNLIKCLNLINVNEEGEK